MWSAGCLDDGGELMGCYQLVWSFWKDGTGCETTGLMGRVAG